MTPTPTKPTPPDPASLAGSVDDAVVAARRYLLSIQRPDGAWCGELEGDTILESEWVLAMHFLGRTDDRRVPKAAAYLRRKRLPSGGWSNYEGGPPEVSVSAKAYFVLKLLGDDPASPEMERDRRAILELGGLEACNSFTKIYLAIFGQTSWDECPAVPPELMLLPDGFVFNVYKMSSWSRGIVVPLSIIWALKPSCAVPAHAAIPELRVGRPLAKTRGGRLGDRAWRTFFYATDRFLKRFEALHVRPFRAKALKAAEAWILERLEKSDGLGAIFPPILNTIFAFRCLGYPMDDPRLVAQIRELSRLEIEDEETLRVQPCFSPVWDTALTLSSLVASGVPAGDPAALKAARWLLDHEVKQPGDIQRIHPEVPVGGWYFEWANEFYPDTDDTSEVLTALARVRFPDEASEARRRGAIERGVAWQLAMQNDDGGWGAFDKGCENEVLTLIPFADHNAMIDPSCEDITGRTLEAFHLVGLPKEHPAIRKAAAYLKRRQLPDGTWYGRWGCNYVYGTWLGLRGLLHAGEELRADRYLSAADWIRRHQNPDGGWGELPRSYVEPETKGIGPSTPSQTAWALMGLMAAGDTGSPAVRGGIAYLLETQEYDGSWKDLHWTGTGFPSVFYLRYHLYATYFPIWALALWRESAAAPAGATAAAAGSVTAPQPRSKRTDR